MNIVYNRLKRVITSDNTVFLEARDAKDGLKHGAIIVLIASICISIGGLLESFLVPGIGEKTNKYGSLGFGLWDIVITPITILIIWPILTGYLHIFCKLAGGKASYIGFLKTMALPIGCGIYAIIPFIGAMIYQFANLLYTFKAIREAHEFSNGKTIGIYIVALVGMVIIGLGVMSIFQF